MRLTALLLLVLSGAAWARAPKRAAKRPAAAKPAAAAVVPAVEAAPRGRMELQGSQWVSGPLTDIEPTIRKQAPTLEACYERQYNKDARLQGVFALELTIESNGRVKDLEPIKDSVKAEALSGCIMSTVRRLQFPRSPAKGDTVVRVLINFVPAPPPVPPPAPPPTPEPPVATSPGSASAPGLRR